ncbi:hypothetical protein F4806DRAFT_470394 [Annulohypoxylon nitens]|nr:hypothetical protein F4806DRAFT_470394 [Annulohypoxylon nitens]
MDFTPEMSSSSPLSITTALPVGPLAQWCLVPASGRAALVSCPDMIAKDATAKRADFISICCDGLVIDTSLDIYAAANLSNGLLPFSIPDTKYSLPIQLSDLVCCPISGIQSEALDYNPGSDSRTTCAPGTVATPLASLAATNFTRAKPYTVTYASVSSSTDSEATVTNNLWGPVTPTYGASGLPVCFWANTVTSVSVAEVTVPVSYVAPSTTSASSSSATSPTNAATSLKSLSGGLKVILFSLLLISF